jgi:glucose/mannose transport system substrate-binding protein
VGRWAAAPYLGLCAVTLLGVVGCSAQTSEPVSLEVYTWWQETSEKEAILSVANTFKEQQGVDVELSGNRNAPTSREELTSLVLNKAPPSTFQANVGADLLRWSEFDYHRAAANDPGTFSERGSMSLLEGLDDLFTAENFYDVLPGDLLDALRPRTESPPYGVPINIHRLNVVYYNVARVAEKVGGGELTLDALCPPEGAARVDFSIAVGIANRFSLTLLIFENLLPALEGAAFYEALFQGNPPPDWEVRVRRTLACARGLVPSFYDGGVQLTWGDAADRVATGEADFTVMGDWVSRREKMKTALEEGTVEAMPFPSKEKLFVFTSDTFPLPVGGPLPGETKALLRTMMAEEVQIEFSEKKGSIPARSDIPLDRLSESARTTRSDFESSARVLATSGLFPPYYPDENLEGYLFKLATNQEPEKAIDDVIDLLRESEHLLAYWNDRKRAGGDP